MNCVDAPVRFGADTEPLDAECVVVHPGVVAVKAVVELAARRAACMSVPGGQQGGEVALLEIVAMDHPAAHECLWASREGVPPHYQSKRIGGGPANWRTATRRQPPNPQSRGTSPAPSRTVEIAALPAAVPLSRTRNEFRGIGAAKRIVHHSLRRFTPYHSEFQISAGTTVAWRSLLLLRRCALGRCATFRLCSNTISGYHLTEVLSKRHPRGASVASLRLLTINRNGVHVRWNTHQVGGTVESRRRALPQGCLWVRLGRSSEVPDLAKGDLGRTPSTSAHRYVFNTAIHCRLDFAILGGMPIRAKEIAGRKDPAYIAREDDRRAAWARFPAQPVLDDRLGLGNQVRWLAVAAMHSPRNGLATTGWSGPAQSNGSNSRPAANPTPHSSYAFIECAGVFHRLRDDVRDCSKPREWQEPVAPKFVWALALPIEQASLQ